MMIFNKSSLKQKKQSPVFHLHEEGKLDPVCINDKIKRKCKQALFHLAPQSSLGSGEKRLLVQFYIITYN